MRRFYNEIWLVAVSSLNTYASTCARINGLKRFNQLSLSRNSFLIFIVFLLTFSWNIWRLYKLRHEVADEDVPEWTVDQFDYHFHAFLRIFLPKMEFLLKFFEKSLHPKRIWNDSHGIKNFYDFRKFYISWSIFFSKKHLLKLFDPVIMVTW